MKRILAFGPHPDDIELLCAGTLAKYAAAGHAVGIAVVTNGEVGSPTLGKAEIAALREREARASAQHLKAEFFWLGYPDEFLFNTPEARLAVIETIRKFRPDVILCPDKDHDYHPDHTTTGQMVWDTHVMAGVPNIKTDSPPWPKIPPIYYYDTIAGVSFEPELYVDVSGHWDTKAAMIRCHKSQETWMQSAYGVSLVEFAETQGRFRGFQAGCRYAEAFRKAKFFPNATDPEGLL